MHSRTRMPNYLINMKRIILISLFFCLAITTILAQVVTTNIAPSKSLPLLPVTWNRIRDASLPVVILLLPVTAVFPICAVPPVALLFKISKRSAAMGETIGEYNV